MSQEVCLLEDFEFVEVVEDCFLLVEDDWLLLDELGDAQQDGRYGHDAGSIPQQEKDEDDCASVQSEAGPIPQKDEDHCASVQSDAALIPEQDDDDDDDDCASVKSDAAVCDRQEAKEALDKVKALWAEKHRKWKEEKMRKWSQRYVSTKLASWDNKLLYDRMTS